MLFDVYKSRAEVQADWPAHVRAWGLAIRADNTRRHVPTFAGATLPDELTDAQAVEWCLALPRVVLECATEDGGHELKFIELEDASPVDGVPGVILCWPDGSLHVGVEPRRRDDLIALYRFSRISLEAYCGLGIQRSLTRAPASVSINFH